MTIGRHALSKAEMVTIAAITNGVPLLGRRDALEVFGISLFRAPTPGGPLGDDPERPTKALLLKAPPQLRAIAAP
jgi:hypothetical protein